MTYARKRAPLDPCPVEAALDMVSGKWKARLLYLLSLERLNFSALLRANPGLRRQVLTSALRDLIQAGVIDREAAGVAPSYGLSERGRALVALLEPVAAWGETLLAERGQSWRRPQSPRATERKARNAASVAKNFAR
jgi:DNA-binding HxlR family transcriptional regulator